MRHLARAHYHLSTMGLDRFIADGEGRLTIMQDQHLVMGIAMKPRPFAARRLMRSLTRMFEAGLTSATWDRLR
ncbi:MAG TPA: hypothetical protein VKI99_00735 [Candidatus Dormibacteraeota bacterium]|nr:hypothetical protein [Candidatus Dormibacteraeota bacterium]